MRLRCGTHTWMLDMSDLRRLRRANARVNVVDSRGHHGPEVHNLRPPSEGDAAAMLLKTAQIELPDGAAVPEEATSMVSMATCLPLVVSIAGRLLYSAGVTLDQGWDGMVGLLETELRGAAGDLHEIENSCIKVSLASLSRRVLPQAQIVFFALGLLPEDTSCTLEILEILFEAEQQCRGGEASRPRRADLRRWLKMLIDRSLVLGSVDQPQLHDLVLDYVLREHTEGELRAAHRRVVTLFRDRRARGE